MYSVLLLLCGTALSVIQWYVVRICYYLHLQYAFLEIIVTENESIESDWAQSHSSQSVRYVLFQSRRELTKTTSWVSAK